MELIIVNVTAQDIKDGTKKSCFDCAINIAITRAMKLSYRNCSIAQTVRIQGCLTDIDIPRWMENWILQWDKGEIVFPFEFGILKKRLPLRWEIIKE